MRKRNGFTLIEVLVVIAIIALLMAIMLPTLQQVKRQAKTVVCQSNLHQWGFMFSSYAVSNDGKFFGWLPEKNWRPFWPDLLRPYYHNSTRDVNDMYCCPMAMRYKSKSPEVESGLGSKFSAWGCVWWDVSTGERRDTPLHEGSYGMNIWIMDIQDEASEVDDPTRYSEGYWKTCDIRGAVNVPVLLDCIWYSGRPQDYQFPPMYDDIPGPYIEGDMSRFCINRHDGFTNSLFMDFSVRKVGLKELWTLKWNRNFDTTNVWTKAGGVQPEDWPQWMKSFKEY